MRHSLTYLLAPVLAVTLAGSADFVKAQPPRPPQTGEVFPEALARQAPALSERAHLFQQVVQDMGGGRVFDRRFVGDVDDFTRAADNLYEDVRRSASWNRLRGDFDGAYVAWARVIRGLQELPQPYRGHLKEVAEKVQPMLLDVGRDVGLRVDPPDPFFP